MSYTTSASVDGRKASSNDSGISSALKRSMSGTLTRCPHRAMARGVRPFAAMADFVAAVESVRRWVEVPDSWAGYRPEPFAAERLWGCGEIATGVGPRRRAGLDATGRVVLVGPIGLAPERWTSQPPGVLEWVDVLEHHEGATVTLRGLFRAGEPSVTTTFDEAGRPLHSSYAGGHPDERYVYGAD